MALKYRTKNLPINIPWLLLLLLRLLLLVVLVQCQAQKILTKPQQFEVRVGETVDLPCNLSQLDEDKVVVWKRGSDSNIIAIEDDVTGSDKRFEIIKIDMNYVLRINSVEAYDSGEYTCSVQSDPPVGIEVKHSLQVNVSPSVKLIPHVAGGILSAEVGGSLLVKCIGSGNPIPNVNWHRKGSRIPIHDTNSMDRLHFDHVQKSDAGVYECRAANNRGEESIAQIEIRVDDSDSDSASQVSSEKFDEKQSSTPWVETDFHYVPINIGGSANLICRYNGDPEPTVDWYFSGFKINLLDPKFAQSKQYATRYDNYSLTTLALNNIQEDLFGYYTCRITNNLGSVERSIYLSGKPGPPALLLRENRLTWTVQSILPIIEYSVTYRLATDNNEPERKIFKSSKEDQQGDYWTHVVILDFLKPNTHYHLQVTAKNSLGWGPLAKDYVEYSSTSSSVVTTDSGTKLNDNNKSSSTRLYGGDFTTLISTVVLVAIATVILS